MILGYLGQSVLLKRTQLIEMCFSTTFYVKLIMMLNLLVIMLCLASFFLCIRSLLMAQALKNEAELFFAR